VQESILSGDTLTGISVMKMVSEMDAGPVYFFHTLEVHYDDTAEDVFLGLSRITEENLGDDLLHIFSGAKAEEQDHTNASFCHKITREDGEISFAKNTAEEIWRKYKAFFPWPGIFYFSKNGKRVKILKGKPHASQGIPCKEGFFLPEIIIEEGKRAKNF
jgi:methionyl-tRNA formyltransferase